MPHPGQATTGLPHRCARDETAALPAASHPSMQVNLPLRGMSAHFLAWLRCMNIQALSSASAPCVREAHVRQGLTTTPASAPTLPAPRSWLACARRSALSSLLTPPAERIHGPHQLVLLSPVAGEVL